MRTFIKRLIKAYKIVVLQENIPVLIKSIGTLEDLTKVQCSDGNWNWDPYMHGMANGMILALSLFKNGCPEYLPPPETWLYEKTQHSVKPEEVS